MRHVSKAKYGLTGISAIVLYIPLGVAAQEAPQTQDHVEVARLRNQVDALQEREDHYLERLDELEARLAAMENAGGVPFSVVDTDKAASLRGTYIEPLPISPSDDPALAFFRSQRETAALAQLQEPQPLTAGTEEEDRRTPAPTEAVVEISEQQQGRFGSQIGLDLGLGYSHFDNARISLNGFLALDAIFLGTISIDQVTSDIYTFDPTLRFGVSDRLFVDANLPYLYRTSNFRSGGASGSASDLVEETVHDDGIGDLNFGISYRLANENARRPDIVLNARLKIPTGRDPYGVEFIEVANSEGNLEVPESLATGSGVYGVSVGASVLKAVDPLVVFGSVTYFHNFSRHFSDIDENQGDIPGTVDVGDAWQLGAGLAFAVNDSSSISMSYSQRIVNRTFLQPDGQDERAVVGSQANVGIVNLGATFSLSDRLALVTNVGIGLTNDSPNMSLSVRLPYRF